MCCELVKFYWINSFFLKINFELEKIKVILKYENWEKLNWNWFD